MHQLTDAADARVESRGFQAVALERARGRLDLEFSAGPGGETAPARLFQEGALKVRRPQDERNKALQVILINTAGGLTGGDRLEIAVAAGPAAAVTLSGQACEKIYRSTGAEAVVRTKVNVGSGALVEWLAQPTILFNGSRLHRTLEADIAPDGRLLALEALVLGRTAMGERMTAGTVVDGWKIRRGGALVYADNFRLGTERPGNTIETTVAGRFTLAGHVAMASLLYVAPDAEARRDHLRAAIDESGLFGAASAWNGLLAARLLAPDGYLLTQGLLRILTSFRTLPMPRAWMT